ncbi:PDZ domain-containing protein [Actinomadura sp. KC216]|uniref:trypsin-like peptidase domain-containing protein n=1 Tax=Actinomadura sp. KC216 TaxID=2530370 RepID=UPI00104FEF7A|nr:trypsin-like peptidase domain-containing protein [Actinomadura sp. KC216]TDB90482.1 PDZ domain-containing protein [Actinomadura sp. KC216]
MTEDNRGPVRAPSDDEDVVHGPEPERQEAAPPETVTDQEIPLEPPADTPPEQEPASQAVPSDASDDDPEPSREPGNGDRLVAGGFAPPDSLGEPPDTSEDVLSRGSPSDMGPQEVPLQDAPPRDMPQPPPVPLDKPIADAPDGRPGFVPYDQDPRAAHGRPPYGGGWPQQSHQGPPPPAGAGRPPMGPPPAPMGPPPGGPRPMGMGMPPGGGPNWAPVPALPPSARGGPGLGLFAIVALIVALVAGAVGAGVGVIATDGDDGGSVSLGGSNDSDTPIQARPPDSVAGVAQRVLPSVVMIRAQASQGEVGGTGFIVNGGYVITNNHVVAGAGGQIQIVFNDKKVLPATVKGTDPSSDVAVLKPEGQHSLPALTVGDSSKIAVGDPVIAIGSPLGLQGSVTTGIVSSLNRAVPTRGEGGGDASYLNAIQTDAAINPGNSGGPLVDAKGRVIGINTAIATLGGGGLGGEQQSGSIGLGFAIPINQGKRVAEEIIRTGSVRQAKLGVLPDPRYQEGGALIMPEPVNGQQPVTKGGPADKAGLKPGDVITKVDGKPIEDATDLIAQIRSRAPGDRIKVTYRRGSQENTVEVTLGSD